QRKPRQDVTPIDAALPSSWNQSSPIFASSLIGSGFASRTLKVVGRFTEVPKTSACCFGNDGKRFRTASEMNGVICLICERSSGFCILWITKFEHCESTVFESSLGRCEATKRKSPYFRPSLAIRSYILLASIANLEGVSEM